MSEIINYANEISFVDPKTLKPHPENPNEHGEEQINAMIKVIELNGFRSPITVSNLSGFVVAGCGRLEASLRMNIEKIPVIYQDFDDEVAEYAHMVADNALSNRSELNLSKINFKIPEIGPFDLDSLGIKDFVIDPSEMPVPFNEPNDKIDPKLKEPQLKLCHNCGVVIENGL